MRTRFGPIPLEKLRDTRLDDPLYQTRLREKAQEAGWAVKGGCIIRAFDVATAMSDGEVIGRTKWVPHAPWFQDAQRDVRVSPNFNGQGTRQAVEKAIAGELMYLSERRHITWLLDDIQRDCRDAEQLLGEADWGDAAAPSPEDLMMVARATELDPDSVERLAVLYEDNDERFLHYIRQLVDSAEACDENEAARRCRSAAGAEAQSVAQAAPASRPTLRPRM